MDKAREQVRSKLLTAIYVIFARDTPNSSIPLLLNISQVTNQQIIKYRLILHFSLTTCIYV